MREYHKWRVKKIILKKEVSAEFEFEALEEIGTEILNGRFKLELEKVEIKACKV